MGYKPEYFIALFLTALFLMFLLWGAGMLAGVWTPLP